MIFILILIYSEEIGTAAIERKTEKPAQASGYILLLEIYDWTRRRSTGATAVEKCGNSGNGGKCPCV